MSTSTATKPSTPAQPKRPSLLKRQAWPIGYVAVILFLFVLYQWILPNLIPAIGESVTAWLPVATIVECLMWAVMALGLNVVVGYAGLLDLGYVAFWAIGGYTAGWLMAAPFNWTWTIHILAPPVQGARPGTHISFWLVCIIAGCVCAVVGILIGAPTLRLRGDYLALVTLGFGEVITQFFRNSNDIAGFQPGRRRRRHLDHRPGRHRTVRADTRRSQRR